MKSKLNNNKHRMLFLRHYQIQVKLLKQAIELLEAYSSGSIQLEKLDNQTNKFLKSSNLKGVNND